MRGFLKGLGELLFPVDVKCALCGGERGILAGSGICECCYGELPLEFMGEQVLGVSCFWALEYQDKAREMIHGLKFDNKRYLARTLGYGVLPCPSYGATHRWHLSYAAPSKPTTQARV